jgi:hypothetical protein
LLEGPSCLLWRQNRRPKRLEPGPAWEATQFTGYGEAVWLIAREVYGLDSLTAEGLEGAQRKLEELRQPGERLRLLSDRRA